MAVLLSSGVPVSTHCDRWVAIGCLPAASMPGTRVEALSELLEASFARVAPDWWSMARQCAGDRSAGLAHAVACSPNASDFGLVLAWAALVSQWARDPGVTLVLCDDPWIFRHLAAIEGVKTQVSPPRLWLPALALKLRGYASRTKAAIRLVHASLALRRQRRALQTGQSYVMVYGHPASRPDGHDGYFSGLMGEMPGLLRMLHVDCGLPRARLLETGGRTFSLHAWGNPLYALTLPFRRWRPTIPSAHPYAWLLRRAEAIEGSRGTGAMIAWQRHCQLRWLARRRPAVVAWPWENHAWERAFVREARQRGVRTVGYQHSVVGPMMYHYSINSLPDPKGTLPDLILCTSQSTRRQLLDFGVPVERLRIGGALRFAEPPKTAYDHDGPVFIAVPFDASVANEMIAAAKAVKNPQKRFLVKDHPMFPVSFLESERVRRAERPLAGYDALSAVVYAATTVGLEAYVAGLPTLRFRSDRVVAVDIMPSSLSVPVASGDNFESTLAHLARPAPVEREYCFGTPDKALWRQVLSQGEVSDEDASTQN